MARSMFRSEIRDERTAAVLGIALAVSFSLCFITGMISHLAQDRSGWFHIPARPAGLFHWNQGLHVATGLASIPLLFAKLWTVFPKLFEWPPITSVAHAVERLALLPLVGGSVLLLFTGVGNINIYRPWAFSFRAGHYAAAWFAIGGLIVHIGAKATTTRRVLRPGGASSSDGSAPDGGLDRRTLLGSVFGIAGIVTLFTVGQTFAPLRKLALLAPRRPDVGPQGFPVNRLARSVGLEHVDIETYRLVVDGPGTSTPVELTYEQLRAMPQHTARVPIVCVEGWSTTQSWTGVRLRDVLALAGAAPHAAATAHALHDGRQSEAPVNSSQAGDSDTLLALLVNDEVLHADHGFPVRLVGHNRPGVHQTKWVGRIEVHP
jgi:hypothetical protein